MRSLTPPAFLAATAAIVPALASSALAGETLFESHLAKVNGGTPCYARIYDEAHLKAHPQQRVKAIEFEMTKENASGTPNTAENFELGFGIKTTRSAGWYTGLAICKDNGAAIDCFLEGDGGRFSLTPDQDGAMRLATGDYGIALEGDKDVLELSGTEGDDKVFILTPTERPVCEAATGAADTPP